MVRPTWNFSKFWGLKHIFLYFLTLINGKMINGKNGIFPKNPDFWLSQKQDFSKKSGLLAFSKTGLLQKNPDFHQKT